jgi:serine/threonine-protein kinase
VTPERWQQVKRVLASALERRPESRDRFVAEACGSDAELRAEVDSLVRAHSLELIATATESPSARGPRSRLEPGMRVGAYQVVALLAAGGMGEVYRVVDTRLGREVALKVLPDAFAADPGRRARLEREAQAVAALNHPNIVTLHSLEEHEGLPFLTMELVEGRTLDRVIPPAGVPAAALLAYALPLCEALAAAHQRGIVHRDLKPGNVMLADDGRLKLLDFGLAAITDAGAFAPLGPAATLTLEGVLVGTCAYMSPEQLQGRRPDCRSDVFALGVVLYELAVGRRPFGGVTTPEVCSAILRDAPPEVSCRRQDLPRAVPAVIMRCLEKNPARRFADAGEVHRALSSAAASASWGPPSVAVLPFLDLDGQPDNELFADGITEDVIAHLAKARALKVIAPTSVASFRRREKGVREIAAALGTATVLDGTVRRDGNRVRIVARLVDAQTEEHLWVATYDRDLTDIFAIQADVALQIAAALRAELSPDEQARMRRPPTHDLEAYRLYLQGRHCLRKYTAEGCRLALSSFEQALALDPEFALAHVGLACMLAESVNEGLLDLTPAQAGAHAKEAVARALSLDEGSGDAHGMAALLKFAYDFDWAGAEAEFERALELSPGSADVYDYYSWMCSALERHQDAIRLANKARVLDPLAHRTDFATSLLRAGRCQEALEAAARVIELEPGLTRGHALCGWASILLGRQREGVAALERAAALAPGSTLFLGQLGQAYAMTGAVDQARGVLRRLRELAGQRYVSPYHIAYVYTGLGEVEEALGCLERACEERASGIYGIRGSFLFTSLRSHPRFAALLEKMNLA